MPMNWRSGWVTEYEPLFPCAEQLQQEPTNQCSGADCLAMPTIATRKPVLDGRAEVITYTRDKSAYYLRQYIKAKRGYKTTRIYDIETEEDACGKALDIFITTHSTDAKSSQPRRGTKEGTKQKPRKGLLKQWVRKYLDDEKEKVDNELLKPSTYKNKKECLDGHFLYYCDEYNLLTTRDIKVGALDKYIIYRSESKALTKRKELSLISGFINYLIKHRMLDAYEAAQKDLVPKVRLVDADWDSNPPIRDLDEWNIILKHLRRYVKAAEKHPNPRTALWRKHFYSLLLVLKQTGMRPDEARRMKWRDIEFENVGRISKRQRDLDLGELQAQGFEEWELGPEVVEDLGRVNRYVSHIRVLKSKTGAQRKITSNSAEVLARWKRDLREYLDKNELHFELNGVELKRDKDDGLPVIPDDVLVFSLPDKNEWKLPPYNTLNVRWRHMINKIEGELKGPQMSEHSYTIYSLRSTRAQELMDMGVDVYLASTQLGHSVAVLEKIYARLPQRRRATKEAAHIEFGKRKTGSTLTTPENIYEDLST